MKVEQWVSAEMAIRDYNNKQTAECTISASFTGPNGEIIIRNAFWDSNDIYKIRYTLTAAGKWKYTINGISSGIREGTILCVPYTGDLPIYKHGFLKAGPRGKYLCHADSTPFFWLGDTHWTFAVGEHIHDSNDYRFTSQFKAIVDKRVKQKFNVYQCNFHCEANPIQPSISYFQKKNNEWVPNFEFFRNDLDLKIAYLAEKGFCIAAGFSWFHSAFSPDAEGYYKMAVKYLIARYGSYPMIWTLAGEVGGYNEALREQSIGYWRKIALEIEKTDSYHHLQTAHYTNERPFPSYYQNEDWFDFTMNQAGHGDYPIDCRPYRRHHNKFPSKPFIESESMYENILTLEPIGRRNATSAMLRRVAYLAIQNGACGYTYGAQGIWHIQWDKAKENEKMSCFGSFPPWYEAIDYPGAEQMTIMRNFYEDILWYTLSPLEPGCFANNTKEEIVVTFSADDLQALFMPSVLANADLSTIAAYYSESNRYQVGFRTLPHNLYSAYWFYPEKGEYALIDNYISPVNGTWFAPMKTADTDAILLLQAKR